MDENNVYGVLSLQQTLLELMREFDQMCELNSIRYTLSSGTLLGDVRYSGFIPWDDDIDVVLDRNNYSKLLSVIGSFPRLVISKELWLDRIQYASSRNTGDYVPTIDLFIWDAVPKGFVQAKVKYYLIAFLQGMIKERPEYGRFRLKEKLLLFISYSCGRLFPLKWKLKWYSRLAQWGSKNPSEYLASYFDQFKGLKHHFQKSLLESFERCPFESISTTRITGYDEYLRMIYGEDYLTPPPESQRVPTHV